MKRISILFVAVWISATSLFGHGPKPHSKVDPLAAAGGEGFLMGTIRAIDSTSLTLETKAGQTVKVNLLKTTAFTRGRCLVDRSAARIGSRAVVYLDSGGAATRLRLPRQ